MENASKALIIAGSILVSILIIAMGVRIFNNAQSAADMSNLDATEVAMFNKKFENYADEQLGSQVKSLISVVISNASTNGEEPIKLPNVEYCTDRGSDSTNPTVEITATGGTTASTDKTGMNKYMQDLAKIRKKVISTHTYFIEIDYATTGIINNIKIEY